MYRAGDPREDQEQPVPALDVRGLVQQHGAEALLRWRRAFGAGESAERLMTSGAGRRIATISHFQALLVVVMVFVAVAMARGFGS